MSPDRHDRFGGQEGKLLKQRGKQATKPWDGSFREAKQGVHSGVVLFVNFSIGYRALVI